MLVRNKSVTILFRQLGDFQREFYFISETCGKGCRRSFLLSGILFVNPGESLAASKGAEVQTRSSYMVTIAAPSVEVHLSANEHSRSVGQVKRGQTYEVLSNQGNGWVKISTGSGEGYIKTSGKASLVEKP